MKVNRQTRQSRWCVPSAKRLAFRFSLAVAPLLMLAWLVPTFAEQGSSSPATTIRAQNLWEHWLDGKTVQKVAIQGDTLWVGTSEGLIRTSVRNPQAVLATYTTKDGLLDDDVQALCADEDQLWIGLNNGLNRFDGQKFSSYTEQQGLMAGAVLTIAANKNHVWLGMDMGLARLDKATGEIANFPRAGGWTPEAGSGAVNPAAGKGKRIYADSLVLSEDGTVWHAAYNLTHTAPDGREIKTYHCGHGLIHSRIMSMALTPDGLWVSSIGGLNRFNIAQRDELEKPFDLRFNSDFHATVPNPPMRIAYDDGILWVVTRRDLTRFDTKLQKWMECREASTQLGARMVSDLLVQGRYLWVATNDGLWRLDKQAMENASTELIADYEDRRLTEIFYPPILGEFQDGKRKGETTIDTEGGANESKNSLKVEWAVPEDDVDHGRRHYMQHWVEFVDATKYDGIVFWMKATKPSFIRVSLNERSGEVWDYHGSQLMLGNDNEWKEFRLPFMKFALHESSALNRVLELNDINLITFHVVFPKAEAGEVLTFWMDEVRYYR